MSLKEIVFTQFTFLSLHVIFFIFFFCEQVSNWFANARRRLKSSSLQEDASSSGEEDMEAVEGG